MELSELVRIKSLVHEGTRNAVQLYVNGKPTLIIGNEGEQDHAKILSDYLESHNIEFSTAPLPKDHAKSGPLLTGDANSYHVVGIGAVSLSFKKKEYSGLSEVPNSYMLKANREYDRLLKKTFGYMGWRVQEE